MKRTPFVGWWGKRRACMLTWGEQKFLLEKNIAFFPSFIFFDTLKYAHQKYFNMCDIVNAFCKPTKHLSVLRSASSHNCTTQLIYMIGALGALICATEE